MVIHDFTACNSNELTIRRGQTVEVLERPHDKPDWCLVRTTDRSPAAEGLVPCGSLCIAHSRSSMEMEGIFNHKGRRMRRCICLPLRFPVLLFNNAPVQCYFSQLCQIVFTPPYVDFNCRDLRSSVG